MKAIPKSLPAAHNTLRYAKWILLFFGALTSMGLAPLYIAPAMFFGLAVLILYVKRAPTWKHAFKYGYCFGFGAFLTGTYWVAFSLLVEADKFAWLIPVALLVIPLFMGFYVAASCALSHRFRGNAFLYTVVFASMWVFMEVLRSWLPFAFPWNLVGYTLMASNVLMQTASLIGIYGMSFVVVLISGACAMIAERKKLPFILCLPILVGLPYYGMKRLESNPTSYTNTYMRIVQPNIEQKIKWDRSYYTSNFRRYLSLTRSPSDKPLDMIVWPEMATPFDLQNDETARRLIRSSFNNQHVHLLLGSARYGRDSHGEISQFWNSLYVLNEEANVLEVYDKHTLVPFGEYLPGRGILPIDQLEAIAMGSHGVDFSRGKGVTTLRVGNLPDVSPLICFEGIFTGRVARYEPENKPAWLLNITNDAWFGDTSGPRQHADTVRLRAIEEGMPMVRVAGTGISYVCDAYGRILAEIPLNTEGVRDLYLPEPAVKETMYRCLVRAIMSCVQKAKGKKKK